MPCCQVVRVVARRRAKGGAGLWRSVAYADCMAASREEGVGGSEAKTTGGEGGGGQVMESAMSASFSLVPWLSRSLSLSLSSSSSARAHVLVYYVC